MENIQEFTITKENRCAIGFTKNTEELVIPDFFVGNGNNGTVKGQTYQITSIGAYAFFHATKLRKVILPDCITVIAHDAFSNCTLLEDVIFPESLIKIAIRAFYNCNLQKIKLPENLRFIQYKAFLGNAITTLTLPSNLKTIGDKAFAACGFLESVDTIKAKKLRYIGAEAFAHCSNLQSFVIPKNVQICKDGCFDDDISLEKVMAPHNPLINTFDNNKILLDSNSNVVWIRETAQTIIIHTQTAKLRHLIPQSIKTVFISPKTTFIREDCFRKCSDISLVINQQKDSIPGAPWGAKNAHIYWIG